MGAFIAKQPNGKYCRFSGVVDCLTHINMTEEDYINLCMEKAKKEAKDILEHYVRPYTEIDKNFIAGNMTKAEFEEVKKKMENPDGEFEIL